MVWSNTCTAATHDTNHIGSCYTQPFLLQGFMSSSRWPSQPPLPQGASPPHTNTTLLSHPTYAQPFCKGGVIEQWVIQQSVSLSGAGPSRIVVVGETVQLKNCMLEVLHSTSQTCSAYCMPSGQPSTHGRRAGSLQVSGAGAPASAVSLSPPHVCPLPGLLAALTGPQNKQSFEQLVSILSIHFQTPIPTTATPARFARSHPGLGCQGCTPEA